MHIISRGLVTTARLLTVCWLLGVFWVYRGLAYPHKAFLFHIHTVVAASAVAMYVFAATFSLEARLRAVAIDGKILMLNAGRAEKLKQHKFYMQLLVLASIAASSIMVLKKSVVEKKGWLLLDREPSLHSWTAIVWEALAATMLFTGYAAYRGASPPALVKSLGTLCGRDTASLRTTFAPVHRLFGQLSLTVVVGMAYLGLTEKNEIWERQLLGYLIVGIGFLLFLVDLDTVICFRPGKAAIAAATKTE